MAVEKAFAAVEDLNSAGNQRVVADSKLIIMLDQEVKMNAAMSSSPISYDTLANMAIRTHFSSAGGCIGTSRTQLRSKAT